MRQKLHIEFIIEKSIQLLGKKFERLPPYERLEYIKQVYIKDAEYFAGQPQAQSYQMHIASSFVQAKFIEAYLQKKSKIYIIAELFGKHLNRTPIKLPLSVIPFQNDAIYCIESAIFFQSTDAFYKTAYIQFYEQLIENTLTKSMVIIAPNYDTKGNLLDFDSVAVIHLKNEFPTLEDALESAYQNSSARQKSAYRFPYEFLTFIVKSLIYIESGEPDLKSEITKSSAINPGSIRKFLKDHCPYEIVMVGYSYNKKKFYHKGTTHVIGHFRWQPCGLGRSRVKLIWIVDHERHYKSVIPEDNTQEV